MRIITDHMSWRTFALIAGGSTLLVAFCAAGAAVAGHVPPGQVSMAHAMVSDVGSVAFGLLATFALLFAASHFTAGNPLRRIWLLLGAGLAVRSLGDVIWTVLDIQSRYRQIPYPSAADACYIAFYFLMVAGLIVAARAYGRVENAEQAIRLDIVAMFALAVVVYTFVGAPIIVDPATSLMAKILGVAYPIGDIIVLLGPAVFIAFMAATIGRAQAARHWWLLAAGLAVMAFSDIAFAWLDWTGRYFSGHPVDYLWMLSLLIIGVAGSQAADLVQGQRVVAASHSAAARAAAEAAGRVIGDAVAHD